MIINIQIEDKELEIHLDKEGAPDSFLIDGVPVDFRTDNPGTKFLLRHDDKICRRINTEWLWDTRKIDRMER